MSLIKFGFILSNEFWNFYKTCKNFGLKLNNLKLAVEVFHLNELESFCEFSNFILDFFVVEVLKFKLPLETI